MFNSAHLRFINSDAIASARAPAQRNPRSQLKVYSSGRRFREAFTGTGQAIVVLGDLSDSGSQDDDRSLAARQHELAHVDDDDSRRPDLHATCDSGDATWTIHPIPAGCTASDGPPTPPECKWLAGIQAPHGFRRGCLLGSGRR